MSEHPTFSGNANQRALAEQIFQIMRTQGALFATDAPIRQIRKDPQMYFSTGNRFNLWC